MAGAFFSYSNIADSVATLSAFNSQTFQAALPLANLLDRRVSKKARTSGALANKFSFGVDLGAAINYSWDVISLLGINVPRNSLPNQTGSFFTVSGTIKLSNVSIGGTDVANINVSLSDGVPQGMPANIHIFPNPPGSVSARYVAVSLSWSVDTGVTYYEAGRLWMGTGLWVLEGVEEGWNPQAKDPNSTILRSRGGQIYADQRARYRGIKIECNHQSRLLVFGSAVTPPCTFQEMFLNAGLSSEVLIVPRTGTGTAADNQFINRTGIYGVFAQEPVITNLPGDNYKVSMEVAEAL